MLIEGAELDAPAAPLNDLLRVGLGGAADDTALVSIVRSMTWRELEHESAALAGAYLSLGLREGDRIASLMPNRIDLVVHYLACFKAGLVATPLNYRYTFREIDHALEVSGAAALLAHVERAEDLAASRLVGGLRCGVIAYRDEEVVGDDAVVGSLSFATLVAGGSPLGPHSPDPSLPAAIFFTSGSTGPAKGVTHTRESLRWMIASAAAAFELDADDVFLPGSSMSHLGSFLWTLSMLSVGGRVVVARTTDAHELLPLLREQQPTVLAMLPAALMALVRDHDLRPHDFASLRICRAGSDKVSTELLTEFAEAAGFPIVEGYGMTEVGLATLNPPSGVNKPGSIGRPASGVSITLRDDHGDPVAPGTIGRIFIRSRSRMVGYWNAPTATEQVVSDEWLDSGDLAHTDDDGYLWFFGRKKQLIVHDGSNISPFEVEDALLEHPDVGLAGVVGIHDTVHGENVRAYVTLREGAARPSGADLMVFCRERVGYKAPEEVVFLDTIPLNPSGKVDRVALKRVAEDHLHPHGLNAAA
ncbi:MAG: class I adenylate-forming enzyme family protein [Solirubrobacteraceae bacterium]